MGLPSEWLLRPPRSSPDPRCGDTGCLGHPGHGRDQSLSPATEQSTQRQCNGDPAEPTGHPLLGTPQGDAGTWWLGPWVPL